MQATRGRECSGLASRRCGAGDEGYHQYYAGGSYVNDADGSCVTWGGTVGDFGWYSSGSGVHCG